LSNVHGEVLALHGWDISDAQEVVFSKAEFVPELHLMVGVEELEPEGELLIFTGVAGPECVLEVTGHVVEVV